MLETPETAIVTTKGQIVIPATLRKRYKIKKGTRVCFLERGGEMVLRPITDDYIDGMKGVLGTRGKALKALLQEKRREREL